MKKYPALFSLAALLTASAALAGESYSQAGGSPLYNPVGGSSQSGWFLGLKGSALWLEDMGYLTNTSAGSIGLEADFEVGWGATIPFGYQFANGFGLGGSLGYYSAGLDEVSVLFRGRRVTDVSLDSDLRSVPMFFNASYDLSLTESLSLTLGAGAGLAWTELDIDGVGGRDYDLSTDGWNFGFQGFSSLNYSINPTTALSVGYRYIQTELDEDSVQGHNLEAGVVVRF